MTTDTKITNALLERELQADQALRLFLRGMYLGVAAAVGNAIAASLGAPAVVVWGLYVFTALSLAIAFVGGLCRV
jgi:hypothetical protein